MLTHRAWLALLLTLAPAIASAQTPRPQNGYQPRISDTAPKTAPIIHPDHTVTFSVSAPNATTAELAMGPQRSAMTKGDDGIWRVTVGPLAPDTYSYNFVVNGVETIDMSNPIVGIGRNGHGSVLDIPGSPPRIDERWEVPHGVVHIREYTSNVVRMPRRLLVYVPPQYEAEPTRRFPVMYLRHGNGGTETLWTTVGHANDMLDNLLSQRKAVPMIIVMLNGYPSPTGTGNTVEGLEITARELKAEVVPLIDRSYRTIANADNRAIVGQSMGATQALVQTLRNLDTFAWAGAFSSGEVGGANFTMDRVSPGFFTDANVKRRLRLLFLSCGTEDPRYAGHLNLVDSLRAHDVKFRWFSTPGGHSMTAWKPSLAELMTLLFKPQT
jgi:enterochelin esterase family protein